MLLYLGNSDSGSHEKKDGNCISLLMWVFEGNCIYRVSEKQTGILQIPGGRFCCKGSMHFRGVYASQAQSVVRAFCWIYRPE